MTALAGSGELVRLAAGARLRTASAVLCTRPVAPPTGDDARDTAILLDQLVREIRERPDRDRLWLLYIALTGCYPDGDTVLAAVRQFELNDPIDCILWLLDAALDTDADPDGRSMELIVGGVVVDVDHAARDDLHTGIQQVVRQTMPLWNKDHDIVLAAWTDRMTGLRSLDERERARVLEWNARPHGTAAADADADTEPDEASTPIPPAVVVPWRSTVVLAEVTSADAAPRMAALARHSGNVVSLIGYDCVPIVSADLVPPEEPAKFVRYLEIVKHAHRVAAISNSAAIEFEGFVDALPTQGLAGPTVVECMLASERDPIIHHGDIDARARPTVLMVGSFEPRKNHLAVLFACEVLWREGRDFELLLIAGSGWGHEITDRIAELQDAGRPLVVKQRVHRDVLENAYLDARFTLFPSLHEGYGLPIAESLAAGTPVIASDFGSMSELGLPGGTVLIDPENDEMLVAAMRTLLDDDVRLAELRAEIARRPTRSWPTYASDLWDALVLATHDRQYPSTADRRSWT